jgi:hypothetical protein
VRRVVFDIVVPICRLLKLNDEDVGDAILEALGAVVLAANDRLDVGLSFCVEALVFQGVEFLEGLRSN